MNGLERIYAAISGSEHDRIPVLPILHSGLPALFSVSLGEYYSNAKTMADVIVQGYHTFGYDGVQLSLGVTGEAHALGAEVYQPEDAGPVLRQCLLADFFDAKTNPEGALNRLREKFPSQNGRMPLYFEAVCRVRDMIGKSAFVLSLLRGPLLTASQLCGIEPLLIAMIKFPERVRVVLEFTTDLAISLAEWLFNSGAHGLMLGEATCSPNFISPKLYRNLVLPYHQRLVHHCKNFGWNVVGMHICGNITPIFEDILSTGIDILDVDYQVPVKQAIQLASDQVCLRGNLDPSSVFRFGNEKEIQEATYHLIEMVGNHQKWILSSGCDIPSGTSLKNIHTFMQSVYSKDADKNQQTKLIK